MCCSSGHSAAVGVGLSSTVILLMRMSMSNALSSWVPVAAASSSAARVVPLVIPAAALHFQLMVVRCVVESDSGGNG